MLRIFLILVLSILITPTPLTFSEISDREAYDKSLKFIESFEWEIDVILKIEVFKKYESIYLDLLKSNDPQKVYVSSVMIGLLKTQPAVNVLKTIETQNINASVGIAFAKCRLNIQYEPNYKFLEKVGTEQQLVGGAQSLSNLNVVILLSLICDKRFPEYADKLKTQEAFQRGAIEVALLRYRKIMNENF